VCRAPETTEVMNSASVVFNPSISSTLTSTRRRNAVLKAALLACALGVAGPGLRAADLFWDSNGATAGAGATPTGIWGTDLFWNDLADGTGTSAAWIPNSTAIFSAGTDATTEYTINIIANQTAAGLVMQEGTAHFTNAAVVLGAGNITVNSGATLSTDSSLRITATAGATMTVDGGTLRTTNPGAAGTFYDVDFAVTIGAGGATFSHITPNILNIVQTAMNISGPGGMTKTGQGVLAIAGTATYLGPTVVNDGELRIRSTANRIPVGTAVTVNNPGILNLNGVSQQIGSLTGNGLVGLGAGTLTVGDATDTTFTGEIRNIANAGAAGVTTGNGRLIKTGAGALTLTASNHYSGSLTISNGSVTAASGAVLCDAICDVVVNGGTLNLSNAAQTVLTLSGSNGLVNLGTGHLLSVNPSSGTRAFYGSVAGDGALSKTGGGTFGLFGNNTFSGATTIDGGAILAGSATALGSTAVPTTVASGASLLFDGPSSVFAIAEPVSIAGTGSGSLGSAIFIQNSANITVNGPITLTGDATIGVSGTAAGAFTSDISAPGNQNLTLQGGAGVGSGGVISGTLMLGTGSLTKLQGGTWTLTGNNNYSGGTVVSAGRLRVENQSGSATGSGPITVATNASLSGPGFVAGAVTVDGTIAPGSSPGTINTGSETWSGGASYLWEINSAAGTPGIDPGWDLINITGGLTINATPANRFNINIASLDGSNAPGEANAFVNTFPYTFTILTTTAGITGFNADAFNVNASAFSNALGNGVFVIATEGNDLVLKLIQRPVITAQPQPVDQTVNPGDDVLLSVGATGTDLSYAWRKDGTPLASATASTLALDDILVSQEGNYDVIVSNVGGSVTSAVARVSVRHAPIIVGQPQNTTVCQGTTATFTVTANGTPAVAYQWRFGGTDLPNQTNATLMITNAQAASAGNYDVVVTNELGTATSGAATLAVNPSTTATPLVSVTNACPGTAVAFSTTAGGTGPFTYVWRKDGGAPLGETTSTLTIAAAATTDAGTYCVEVTGACGSVTNCATLTIAPPVSITGQPQNFNGVQGNTATFSVTATPSSPLAFQWRYNGANLANGGQISGATSATLSISSLNVTNEGAFDVIVTSCSLSVTSQVAVLNVRPISAVHFDFDTVGQSTNNLPTTGNGGTDPLVPVVFEVGAGGVGNTRALDLLTGNGSVGDSAFPAMAYDFSAQGKILRGSVMFKLKAPTANDTVMMIGFAGKVSRLDSGDENVAFMGVKLRSSAQPALTYILEGRHKVFAGTTVNSLNATAALTTFTAGNWYRLSLNLTNVKVTAANSFDYGAVLQDMGATGTTPGAIVSAIGQRVVNADMVNDNSVFADIRYRETAGNDFIDNLSINTLDGPVVFLAHPENQTVLQGRPATINAYIDGTPPYTYQWIKDGADIPGATDWQYKIAAVSAAHGGSYALRVTGTNGVPVTSDAGVLTVTPDTTGPVLLSVGSLDGDTIGVCFDEPLDLATATTPGNYSVSGGATVGRITLRADQKSVVLYVSPAASGAFTVTVSGVRDVYGNTMTTANDSANVASHLSSLEIGGPLPSFITADGVFSCNDGDFDITAGGADVWGNSDQFRFTYQPKTGDFDVKVMIGNQTIPNTILKAGLLARESLDPASRTLHAIVNPPFPGLDRYETGQRTTYAGTTASWGSGFNNGNRFATPPNSWVRLQRVNNTFTAYAGSTGTDWVVIGRTTQPYPPTILVGLEMVSHIQGRAGMSEFRSYGDFAGYPAAVVAVTNQPASTNINAGQTATFSVGASVTGAPASELQYQWQRSDGSGGFTNVPTANAASATFATPPLFGPDSGAQYRALVRVPGIAGVASSPATVTVNDAAAPTILAVTAPGSSSDRIIVVFSEPVSAGSATLAANYALTNAAGTAFPVNSATFFGGPNTIVLTTSGPLPPGQYFLVVNNVQDLASTPNTIAANTVARFQQLAAPLQPVVVEVYQDVGNAVPVSALQTQALYGSGQPTYIVYSNLFGFNMAISGSLLPGTSLAAQDNYGVRVYSHFIPPTNGNYKFWIRSDDGMQLLMNTNGPSGVRSAVVPSSTNHPAAEVAGNVFDDTTATKYLNFDELNAGLTVTPVNGASVVTGVRFSTANDADNRDPMTFVLEGANSPAGPWTLIASGNTGLPLTRLTAGPNVIFTNETTGEFTNATAYTSYRLRFPTVRDTGVANSMQISEISLLDASLRDVTDSGVVLIAENTANNANYTLGTTPANSRTNISLIGGQPYYIEALMKEGGGGDGFSVTWTDASVSTAPPNSSVIPISALAYPAGSAPATPVVAELYTGAVPGATFGGSDLASLGTVTNHAKWGLAPDVLVYQKHFAFQPNLANTRFDNYAGRIYSYFVAPSNGLYRFYVRSDDAAQLYMNTNAVNSTDPAGAVLLGQLTAFTGAYTLLGQNVPLVGGQSYYIEARWKEGTGGDGIAMAFRAQSDAAVPPIGPIVDVAPAGSFAVPVGQIDVGPIALTGITPASPALSEGQTVTFAATGLTGAQPYSFTWFKNGAFVGSGPTYTTLPAQPGDNNAVYTLVVSNLFSSAQASATVTVTTDTTPPTVTAVTSHSFLKNVIVTFSEPVNPAQAGNTGNYQIPGLTVLGAFVEPSLRRVSLSTTPQTPGAAYVVTIGNIHDVSTAENQMTATSIPFNAWQATGCEVGALLTELFTNMTGVAIADLTGNGGFANNIVDSLGTLRSFQWTSIPPLSGDGLQNYGLRISGRFIPPSNGVYRFYIRSDDASQVFLNTNSASSTNPEGKVLIAREDTCCKAYGDTSAGGPRVSVGIPLNGGQAYYIEALLKEGGGGDFFQMAFREAGDPSTPPNNEVASGQFFALPPNPVDTVAPTIVRTYSLSGNSVVVEFSETINASLDMGANPTLDPFSYEVNPGAQTPMAVTARADGRSVLLDLATPMTTSAYTVDVQNARDAHCNSVSANVAGVVFALGENLRDNIDVGAHNTNPTLTGGTQPVVNPSTPGSATLVADDTLTIVAGGTDIWDSADGFHFAYGARTGNFDVVVRVESLVPRNPFAKAGLMVRENLTGGSRNLTAVVAPPAVPALDGSGTGANRYEANRRDAQNGVTAAWSSSNPTPAYPNAWVRLRRVGDTFFAYSSSDGVNWVQYATTTTVYPATVLVGIATTSHNNNFGQTTTAIYHGYDSLFPPVITDQPDSVTILTGQSASFNVAATGTAPLSYQWRFNGANIANETGTSLAINNATAANAGNYDVVVSNISGSVTSVVAVLTVQEFDFGDAPPPYPVLLANNGARHIIVPGFHLGASVDSEANGQPSATANGDGSDENGVVAATAFIRGQTASANVAASAAGRLDAWIDWNADGDWADAGEKVANNVPVNAGVNTLPVPVPTGAAEGPTFVRLRFSSAGGLSFDGQAQDGEVEDYVILVENRPPVAVDDSATTGRDQVLTIPAATLLANDTDPNGDTLIITAVTPASARGGTVALSGTTVTYTPPAGYVGSDRFDYTIADKPTGGLTDTGTVCVVVSSVNLAFPQPVGGWTYVYDGSWTTVQGGTNIGGYHPNVTLDGSWSGNNGSSEWPGDARGAGNGPLGGISTNNGILTIEDINLGSGTGNNRKIYFTRDFANDPATTNANRILDGGVTISFRARLTQPDVVPASENTTNTFPDGWGLFSDGKAHFNVRESGSDSMIGFSLVQQTEPDNGFIFPAAGLTMNRLNGDAPTANVDSGDAAGGVTNVLALDPNVFHEFWITIRTNDATAGNGTHVVNIYVDGATTPSTFNITAGNGDEGANVLNGTNFLAIGLNNSAGRGGLDVDFYAYKQGVIAPTGFNALQIARQGNSVIVSWPASCGNDFVVEETPSLQPGSIVWTQVAGAPVEVNGRNQLTLPIAAGSSRFYRLRQQ
jgi:autotransporter-associated beta strand protein